MVEQGVMDGIKDGGGAGAGFGFTLAAIRLYFSAGDAGANKMMSVESRSVTKTASAPSTDSQLSRLASSTHGATAIRSSVRFLITMRNKLIRAFLPLLLTIIINVNFSAASRFPMHPNFYPFTQQPFSQLIKTTGSFAGIGAVYLGTRVFLRDVRDSDDAWNSVIAGACAGSLVGLRNGSIFAGGGAAAAIAFVLGFTHVIKDVNGTLGPIHNSSALSTNLQDTSPES